MPRPAHIVAAAVVAALVVTAVLVFLVTRSGSSADKAIQGDVDCDNAVSAVDALQLLRSVAKLPVTAGCIDLAADADCDGAVSSIDALRILRYVAQLPIASIAGCPAIGEDVGSTATFTTTPSASPTVAVAAPETPITTPTSTATAALTPSPGSTTPPIACPPPAPPTGATPHADIAEAAYRLVHVVPDANWGDMLDFALVPGTQNAAVVARQNGEIWRVSLDGSFGPAMFGNLDSTVTSGGEQGLLSLAFSPEFESDGRVYVYYTRRSPNPSALSRFQAAAACMDTKSETVIMEIPQPYPNHNGGRIVFGHDGNLYLSLGDGGSGGDPLNNGQNLESLLGKILRLAVTGEETYAIPTDNPFAKTAGLAEIFAYGFRNPWRISVDRDTGDIWAGDVGQSAWEELDKVTAGGNYGWRCYEGFEPYNSGGCATDPGRYAFPRAVYPNQGTDNQAIVGGYVYRGTAIPGLFGHYVYADTYSGRIWTVNTADNSEPVQLMDTSEFIYSFAEQANGELLVLTAGGIYRLATAP